MTILPFDEINALAYDENRKSVPIDRYFDEMVLPESEKRDRKQFARKFNDTLFDTLSMLYILLVRDIRGTTLESVKNSLESQIMLLLMEYTYPDSALENIVRTYVSEFVETTALHSTADDPKEIAYWFSSKRALFNAEDQTNTIFNYEQFRQEKMAGKSRKTWITMRDSQVRKTHAELEGVTIPIDDVFTVGTSLMRYPKDISLGASPEEIVNCRCTIMYT